MTLNRKVFYYNELDNKFITKNFTEFLSKNSICDGNEKYSKIPFESPNPNAFVDIDGEVEYIIKGLKKLRIESEKILILISNIMTWIKTPNKIKSDAEDEVVIIHPEKEDKKEEKP